MKFSGTIGFWFEDVETSPGVYNSKIVEKKYYGDVYKDYRTIQGDSFSVSNQIIILTDLYFKENWPSAKYVIWNGLKLTIKSVNVSYPRSTIEIGGPYNGKVAD